MCLHEAELKNKSPIHKEQTNQTKKADTSVSLLDKMYSETEMILVPVRFLKGIEDKVAQVKETLLCKQAVLSQVKRG
jgi:hypothetical protein